MTISFQLINFKSLKKMNRLELKPLTILCGSNGCGKSSILKSLLMLRQSSVTREEFGMSSEELPPFLFNGPLTQLGSWEDTIHRNSDRDEIGFRWNLTEPDMENPTVDSSLEIRIIRRMSEDRMKLAMKSMDFVDKAHDFTMSLLYDQDADTYTLSIRNLTIDKLRGLFWLLDTYRIVEETRFRRSFGDLLFNDISGIKANFDLKNIKREQLEFQGMFPLKIKGFDVKSVTEKMLSSIFKAVEETFENESDEVKKLRKEFMDKILEDLNLDKNEIFDRVLSDEKIDRFDKKMLMSRLMHFKMDDINFNQFDPYSEILRKLRHLWSSIRYIGPLRDEPRRFYAFDQVGKLGIGLKGEYTAHVLSVLRNSTVPDYFIPQIEKNKLLSYELQSGKTLMEALNTWLFLMELPTVDTEMMKNVFELKVRNEAGQVSISDTGFGVSQVLPILVEAIRMKPGETLILEQPEIHLHPKTQSKLADFLICMAKSGRHFVIETHSEYMIKRLCLRIAQDQTDETGKLINVQFVEQDRGEGAILTPVSINPYGSIENWPRGFFDESDATSIIEAGMMKRMMRHGGKKRRE